MQHPKRLLVIVVLVVIALHLTACGAEEGSTKIEPAHVEEVEGSEFNLVTLTEKAAERLDIQSEPTREEEMDGAMKMVVPYSAVIYGLHGEINAIDARLRDTMAREASQWELVSAVVRSAADSGPETPRLSDLIRTYQELEEASQEESLEAEARLADQVYRLSTRLCVDGCQGCLHTGTDLMPAALAESVVSLRLLRRLTA